MYQVPRVGYEMGGKFNLGVAEAGFGAYVKTHKPWFIGRKSFLINEAKRTHEVFRFRFEEKHTRIAHLGDNVFDKHGRNIGVVTSCAIDKDNFLTGLAFISKEYANPGKIIYIYQKTSSLKEVVFSKLKNGEKIALPSRATIISRFPKL